MVGDKKIDWFVAFMAVTLLIVICVELNREFNTDNITVNLLAHDTTKIGGHSFDIITAEISGDIDVEILHSPNCICLK